MPSIALETLDVQDVFAQLASHSELLRQQSERLRFLEDGLRQLQAQTKQVDREGSQLSSKSAGVDFSNENTGKTRSTDESSLPRVGKQRAVHSAFTFLTDSDYRLKYEMRETIWDACWFIGTSQMTLRSSVVISVCLLLHLTVLMLFFAVCARSLTEPVFDDSSQQEFRYWRSTVAHDVSLRNRLTGESLASAVCNKRLSLPFATLQISMVKDLEEYLVEPFLLSRLSKRVRDGSLMCSIALCIWYLTLTSECRGIASMMGQVLRLPNDSLTQFEHVDGDDVRLVSISYPRRNFILALCVVQIAVVVILFWIGTNFLVFETSIREMILNAMALEFVLKLDELVYSALLPQLPKAMMKRILPLEFSTLRANWNSCGEILFIGLILAAIASCVGIYMLIPFVAQIEANWAALCGGVPGSHDFVVAVDAVGIPWAAATPNSSDWAETYAQSAVAQAQITGFTQAKLSPAQRSNMGFFMQVADANVLERYSVTLQDFKYPKDWTMINPAGMIPAVGWPELNVLRDEDFGDAAGTVYNNYLQNLVGTGASCAQVVPQWCHKHGSTAQAVLMRKLCPGWCGCDSPTTGTVSSPLARDVGYGFIGCTSWTMKRKAFVDKLGELPCMDTTSRHEFTSWLQGVGDAPNASQDNSSQGEGLLADKILAAFDSGGCPEVVKVDIGAGVGSKVNLCTESSLPAICPVSCGCGPNLEWIPTHAMTMDFCPYKCGVAKQACLTIKVNHSRATGTFGPVVGFACEFPFKYEGWTYHSCTSADWSGPWCAVTLTLAKASLYWGDCPPDLPPGCGPLALPPPLERNRSNGSG